MTEQTKRIEIMWTTECYFKDIEATGDRIYSEGCSKEAKLASKISYELAIQKAVDNGGTLEVENFTTGKGVQVESYKLRTSPLCVMSISKKQAVEFCKLNS